MSADHQISDEEYAPPQLFLGLGSRGNAEVYGWNPIEVMEPKERKYAVKWIEDHWIRAKKLFDNPNDTEAYHGCLGKASLLELRHPEMALICYRVKWRDEISPYLSSIRSD